MKQRMILTILTALILAHVSSTSEAQDDAIRDFVMNGLTLGNNQPIHSIPRGKIADFLGKPTKIETRQEQGFFGEDWKITTLKYYNLRITYNKSEILEEEYLSFVRSCRSDFNYKYDIKMKDTVDEVIKKLGKPHRQIKDVYGDELTYGIFEESILKLFKDPKENKEMVASAVFMFIGGKLLCIEWTYSY